MAISVRGVIPEKSSHCSPLQPTLTWKFYSGGLIRQKYSHCSPTLTSFYPSEQITPTLLHQFTPLDRPKRCKNGGLICRLPPHSYTILPPWKPNAAQKDVRILSCIFLKNPPLAAPLLHHFTPLGSPTFTTFYPSILHYFSARTWRLPVLNPQPLYPQLRRLDLQTINACPTLDSL